MLIFYQGEVFCELFALRGRLFRIVDFLKHWFKILGVGLSKEITEGVNKNKKQKKIKKSKTEIQLNNLWI